MASPVGRRWRRGCRQRSPGDRRTEGHWQRLHPLSPLVRAGRGVVPLLVILWIPTYHSGSGGEIEHAGIVVLAFVLAFVSWLVTRWRVEAGVLRVDSGLIRRTSERFPLSQIQAIDVVRPGLARVFGLAELPSGLPPAGAPPGVSRTSAITKRRRFAPACWRSATALPRRSWPRRSGRW